jgi:alkanesulfonate monooxygenase SsuD/methylene tetrahydromethanopterin reductase-like flavin-dependent oxidoreductase (luciferase family)
VSNVSFGIKTAPQHTTYEAIRKVWKEADAISVIEHAWLFDHFAPIHSDVNGPCLEGWTLLTALLANMAATVDIISNGRLDLGMGAGWNEYEHHSMGIPLYAPGERIRRLGEACALIKQLFTQDVTSFKGRYYQLEEARCEPKPIQKPHPPLLIGGGGEQLTLRIVAEHADIWNYPNPRGTAEELKHKVAVLERHCADVGRDPASIRLSVQPMVNYDDLEETTETVKRFVDAGATHVVLNLRPPYPDGIVHQLADEVIARV